MFGISRAGAVWCPINPRNEAAENRELLDLFDCTVADLPAVASRRWSTQIRGDLPKLHDRGVPRRRAARGDAVAGRSSWRRRRRRRSTAEPVDDLAMIVGTGGTTGRPKGVMLTGTNLETMTALTLMSYPFEGRPVYLALAPLTHAAGVLCFPVLALGGEIVVMRTPGRRRFLELVERHRVTHTFLPPTLIYMLLDHPALDADGPVVAAVLLVRRGADVGGPARGGADPDRPGDGPAVRPDRGADDDLDDAAAPTTSAPTASVATRAARRRPGGPTPLVTVAIMDDDGRAAAAGRARRDRRARLAGDGAATTGTRRPPPRRRAYGWHHTGDIGYLDDDGFLFIVDRAKDMIITGGFNVYSTEVEQALMAAPGRAGLRRDRPARREVGRAGDRRRPAARRASAVDADELTAFVKERIGSVKAPKQVEVWADLPRSKVGKVLKTDIRAQLLAGPDVGVTGQLLSPATKVVSSGIITSSTGLSGGRCRPASSSIT